MEYKFTDIFDIKELAEICESFTKLSGMVTALLDLEGNVHIATGWQDICTKFHRINPCTSKRCTESDTFLANKLKAGEKYNIYKCKNGLIDIAVPVVLNDEHVGNFFTGQFFFEAPDYEYFKKQAAQFNFKQDDYLEALGRVPIFSYEHVKKNMDFMVNLTQLIGKMGLEKLNRLKSEERLNLALDSSNMGTWKFSVDTSMDTRDENLNKILGLEAKESTQEVDDFVKYVHPEDRERVGKAIESSIKEGKPYSEIFRIIQKNGNTIWVHDRGKVYYKEDGSPDYMTGALMDITNVRNLEKDLLEYKNKLDLAMSSASAGIWEWNFEDDYTSWDDRMLDLWGLKREEFGNDYESWKNTVHPEDLSKAVEAIHEALDGKKDYNVIYRVKRKSDGETRYIKAQSILIKDDHNKPLKMVGLCYDVTELQKLNRDLMIQRNLAQESSKQKSEFMSMMSHELRTPLNAVIGFSELLLMDNMNSNLTENQIQHAHFINSGGKRLLKIVDEVLDITNIDLGKVNISRDEVNINELFESSVQSFKEIFIEKNIKFNSLIKENTVIYADKKQARKIITYILSNSLKFTDEGGTVTVNCEVKDNSCILSFKDTGIGIDKKNKSAVFGLFRQIDTELSRSYEGTGVGMYITKRIVELMKGEIWFESEGKGKGTTFFVSLPI